jgi:hypothetical protein
MNHIDRELDRAAAIKRRMALNNPPKPVSRAAQEPIAIYMLPIIETENCKMHCLFCGNPFIEIRNKVMYISAYEPHHTNKVAADRISCKRCKQRYIKLV